MDETMTTGGVVAIIIPRTFRRPQYPPLTTLYECQNCGTITLNVIISPWHIGWCEQCDIDDDGPYDDFREG